MITALIVAYVVVAIITFAVGMWMLRDANAYADPIEVGFATVSTAMLASVWPFTLALFGLTFGVGAIVKAVIR